MKPVKMYSNPLQHNPQLNESEKDSHKKTGIKKTAIKNILGKEKKMLANGIFSLSHKVF